MLVLAWVSALAQGPLINGGNHDGVLLVGLTNTFTFTANVGDHLILRAGTSNFTPRINLYGPSDVLVGSAATASPANRDAYLTHRATNSGTFTVELSSAYTGGLGTYRLHFLQVPGTFIVPTGDEGGALTNGANNYGTLDVGDLDMWSFTAAAGDSIALRSGTTNFTPRIDLYGPNGVLVESAYTVSPANRDEHLTVRATNSGTFTVVLSSLYLNGEGTYRLHLIKAPGEFVVPPEDEGGALTNGANNYGTMDLGDQEAWSFPANVGDSIVLRAGTTNFVPWLRIFGPNGVLVESAYTVSPANRDAHLTVRATNSGTFTVVLSSLYLNGEGTYRLHLVQVPGEFVVPPEDEGGALTNGANNYGTMDLGDQEAWSFPANVGDSILLRAGTTNFVPWLRIFGPNGVLVESAYTVSPANRDAQLMVRATNSGTFTVVLSSLYLNGEGTYGLQFVKVPGDFVVPAGDEGGPLPNGAADTGTLHLGDLEAWSFPASAGDSIIVRVGTTNFTPWLRLFGPTGVMIVSEGTVSPANRDAFFTLRATNSGTFVVVLASYYLNGEGSYRVQLAQAPGGYVVPEADEGGTLTNGANHAGLLQLGDVEMFSFLAGTGESVVLRVGATDFVPLLALYGPTGVLVDSDVTASPSNRDATFMVRTTNSGIFTVVLHSAYRGDSGTYQLRFVHVPGLFIVPEGDDGGGLSNAVSYSGTMELGDEDLWRFTACRGEMVALQVDATNYSPYLALYGPDGTLVRSASVASPANRLVTIDWRATNSGTFTVVLHSTYLNGTGTYQLTATGLSDTFRFCQPRVVNTNVNLVAVGGPWNAPYVLVTATNVSLPLDSWLPLATNQFDAYGVGRESPYFDIDVGEQFFRLRTP